MGTTKKVVQVEDVEIKVTSGTDKSVGAIVVAWKGMNREFSKEVHGEDFVSLAKQFAEKVGGELV